MNVYNFSAGPAMIPAEVIDETREEGFNFCNLGISVMEISHRSREFEALNREMEKDLRQLMGISDDYAVLFLQGGARTQFAMVPLNLLNGKDSVDYFDTGVWSLGAIEEAKRYAKVNVVSSSKDLNYNSIAVPSDWKFSADAAYVHYTTNETISGLQFKDIPQVNRPLVADMSSDILSYPLDVNRFGLIYAAAQKNMGAAGLTTVIVKKSLLGEPLSFTPTMLRYQTHLAGQSLYNTIPTLPWFVTSRVLKWLKKMGGITAIQKLNQTKSGKLYKFIDDSEFYSNHIDPAYRSDMNVSFHLRKPELTQIFAEQAKKAGMYGLLGHPKLGGLRASTYNAMTLQGVDTLLQFMQEFEKRNH